MFALAVACRWGKVTGQFGGLVLLGDWWVGEVGGSHNADGNDVEQEGKDDEDGGPRLDLGERVDASVSVPVDGGAA